MAGRSPPGLAAPRPALRWLRDITSFKDRIPIFIRDSAMATESDALSYRRRYRGLGGHQEQDAPSGIPRLKPHARDGSSSHRVAARTGVSLRPRVVPKHLRPLHPVVHLFDQRLHQGRRYRQPKASIMRIVHATAVVPQITCGIDDRFTRIVLVQLGRVVEDAEPTNASVRPSPPSPDLANMRGPWATCDYPQIADGNGHIESWIRGGPSTISSTGPTLQIRDSSSLEHRAFRD